MAEQKEGRVLVVDDDYDAVQGVTLFLESEGFTVSSASNGAEGMEKARSIKPDLIILDVMMQEKDGLTTFGDLRSDPELKKIPVIMLTSVSEKMGFSFTSDDMGTYFGEEPDAFMTKPFDPARLLDTVNKLIAQKGH
jgi:adenylate cyclase